MSFFGDATTEINGKIATLKTVSEKASSKAFTKYNKASSDINDLMDSIMNIFNQLGGYKDMIKSIENILSTKMDDIEEVVKSAIKIALKKIISCSVEPTIGNELINSGVTFDIKKVDPMSILSIDPMSENGSYGYFDNAAGIDSKDFNVFLYAVIQKSMADTRYTGDTWNRIDIQNNESVKTPLFNAIFKEYDETTKKSNLLIINVSETFRGEKLSYFISEYLDSIKLFNNVQIISSIFDELLGAQILSINKTTEQISAEKMIAGLVNKMINNVDTDSDVIDDSFYIFSNDTYNQMLEESEKKKNGKFTYNPNEPHIAIDQQILLDSLNGLKIDGLSISQQTKVLTDTIDAVTNDLVSKGKVEDKYSFSFKFDFIKKIITKLTTTIAMVIFSPKIIYLFSMTARLYGLTDPDDIVEFIKSNINIFKIIIIKIRDILIQIFIDKIKEMLAPLIAQVSIELVKEKFAMYKKQIDDIISLIENAVDTVTTLVNTAEDTTTTVTEKATQITS